MSEDQDTISGISRRNIRIKVFQTLYAQYASQDEPGVTFKQNLGTYLDDIRAEEKKNGDHGDSAMLLNLYYKTLDHQAEYDQYISGKAEHWELDRIALVDRILLQMGISEMLEFPEIPVKVTINEYLDIAKEFSTPKSSKFINGILDNLHAEFRQSGKLQKSGRGLIDQSLPKSKTKPSKEDHNS